MFFLESANSFIWTYLFLPCFSVCGLVLTWRFGALQFRRFGRCLRSTVGGKAEEGAASGTVTPAQAASTALAATVGTGNIVGTAQAIAMGGPGAVFWLWAAAGLGMAIKYAEVYLGVRFRRSLPDGGTVGGPMYYIRLGMGRRFAPLAALYAVLAAVSALCMGNLTQVSGAVSALSSAVELFSPMSGVELFRLRLCLGILLALLTAVVLSGGARQAGRVSAVLVPVMALVFLAVTVSVVAHCAGRLPGALADIFTGAFRPRAVVGAAGGLTLRQTILWGFRRGAFSNEAGLGSAATAHGGAAASSPAEHGLWGIFEVFADTMVICSATALAILCAAPEIPWGTLPGPELLGSAIAAVFGRSFSVLLLSLCLFLFAFSSVIGSSVYGEACLGYLFGSRSAWPYRAVYSICVLLGSVLPVPAAWLAADLANGLMALPNFAALFALSGLVAADVKGHFFGVPKEISN